LEKAGTSRICLSGDGKHLKADCGFGLDDSKSSEALLLRCSDAQMHFCPDAQMPRCTFAQMRKCPDALLLRCSAAEVGQDRDSGVDRPSTSQAHTLV
ncbi:MAG: hypothetical protein KIH06_06695, partial [Kiritimatiellae bacterium]|nr:hypothetical protein [Kiritimatiellia bacterium]